MSSRARSRGRHGPRRKFLRSRPHREPKPVVLIVCEGSKTEPNYFSRFRIAKGLSAVQVKIVGGESGTHPRSIVAYAKALRNEAQDNGDDYDEIWCVFDRDQHERIHQAFVQARNNKFRIAFSNPSFELWYLLHYAWQGAAVERVAINRTLKKHIPNYAKSSDFYDKLLAHQAKAIKRSKELRSQHHIEDTNCTRASPNPSTWVDQLVEYLNTL